MRISLIVFSLLILLFSCKTSQKVVVPEVKEPELSNDNGFRMPEMYVGFYNVENLFDTVDDPKVKDEEWLPTSKKKWTTERYEKKIGMIAQVIEAMDAPIIMGLCEIENATVLKDLVESEQLKKYGYEFAHFDSPDKRGIDNALLYQPAKFAFSSKKKIRIEFPMEIVEGYTTRDVLIVSGRSFGQDITFIVNHWPSRRGGLEASEPKRVYVAQQVKLAVDSLLRINPNVIVMGDFNDEPDNNSISETLDATGADGNGILKNLFYEVQAAGDGSYNYRGNWNMLDQIMVGSELTTNKWSIFASQPEIIRKEWMIYNDKKDGPKPNRTYGGPNYYGGYSDHFPVRIHLLFQ